MKKKMILFILLLISNIFFGCGDNSERVRQDSEVINNDPLLKLLNNNEQKDES
jgi:hypothetical protein